MRIGKTDSFFEKIQGMGCMEEVYNEVKTNEHFLDECKDILHTLRDEYKLNVDLNSIQNQRDYFLNNITPVSNKDLIKIKKEWRDELIKLNIKIGKGDLDILAYCKKENSTVITHDETLFSLLADEAKTLFLIEFIMEDIDNLDDIGIGELNYLYYHCLARYDLSLKELREKLGIAGNKIFIRKNKILKFLNNKHPFQNVAITSKSF
jgi:hypothetical protein